MGEAIQLTPAEAKYLLTPNMSGMGVIKVMLLMLIARGLLRVEETQARGLLGQKKIAHLRVASQATANSPGVSALLDTVREAQADDGTVKAVAKRARRDFAPEGTGFVRRFIAPALIERGLLWERKFLFVRLYTRTPQGNSEAERIKAEIVRAKEIPKLLQSDPAQAATLAASLGGLLLLVDKLNAHYKPLAAAMRDSGMTSDIATSDGFDFGGFDAAAFDASAFDALGSDLSSFDSGFSDGGGGDGDGGDSSGHH